MMKEGNVEFWTTVLNVPDAITPLKFQAWLLNEVDSVQKNCLDSSFVIIKLFLPMRIRLAFMRDELNKFLQDIPGTYPNIHWVDVVQVNDSLTSDELAAIQAKQQNEILNLNKSVNDFLRNNTNKK
jgi:hypothetical protein